MNLLRPTPDSAGAPAPTQPRRIVAKLKRYAIRTAIAIPTLLVLYVLVLIPFTPSVRDLRRAKSATPSVVMSADGVKLAEFKRPDRQWVPLDKISPNVVDALISTEDRRFYDHHGIDIVRTIGAALSTLSGNVQGGSTITQQLARNLYADEIGRSFSLTRKIREAITALKIEATYTKREILETYLNTVPFLFNAFGIERAAQTYFDKGADRLDVVQAATLVGMLKASAALNPVRHPERALERRNLVLEQMAKNGKLTASQVAELSRRPMRLHFERQPMEPNPVPHIVRHLQDWLIDWAGRHQYYDGLIVRTTIDSRLQDAANKAVAKQLTALDRLGGRKRTKDSRLQAGFVAIDPRNGYIRAWVGSRDFETEEFDHVSQARRQPGSVFKPFVYAAAFTAGMRPSMKILDAPPAIPLEGGGYWEPKDTIGGNSYQPMTLHDALVYSKNTVTAQVITLAGVRRVINLAWAMGVRESKLDAVPALALGVSPVTLREMVSAYGTIADGGYYVAPTVVSSVEDHEGHVLATFGAQREAVPAMTTTVTLELIDALRGVVTKGTGAAIKKRYKITADVAGKTGTTQEYTDAWFVLMHPQLVAGTRVGFNERAKMGSWGTGGKAALPIVADVFQQALKNKWIDPTATFGVSRPPPPRYEGSRDPIGDSPVVRHVFGEMREKLHDMVK